MIPEVAPYNNYTGDSSTTKFDFDFFIEDSTQLVVQLTQEDGTIKTLTNDTDYTIHEVGNENGSYITFPITGSSYSTLSSSEIISLSLSLPIAQESEYGTSSELDLVSLEYSLDYLTRICQIINRQVTRALKVAEGSNISTDELALDVEKIADISDDVSIVAAISGDVTAVKNNAENINLVAEDLINIDKVANDLSNIDAASSNAILAKKYAIGVPSEPEEGSAKYWAQQAATGQIQSDWEQSDNTKKDFIKNKPDLSLKQDKLVSGVNIKNFNGVSLLGEGDIEFNALPDQEGNAGKFLTTDGTDASWVEIDTGANKDINNLTSLGNARLQYAPFAINAGTVLNGENATLKTPGGTPIEVTKYLVPQLSANTSDYGTATVQNARGNAQAYQFTTGMIGAPAYNNLIWTIQLNNDYYMPANKVASFTIASNNSVDGAGGYYGIFGVKITYIYTDNTEEVVFDNSNFISHTWNNGAPTFATGTCTASSEIVKGIRVEPYRGTAQYCDAGYFTMTYVDTVGTSSTLVCDPCTVTTCDGRTQIFETSATLDISTQANGSYSIFKDYETGELLLTNDFKMSNLNPSADYWLDNSTTPANLKIDNNGIYTINNDLVYIGDCTVSSSLVTALKNREFNDSGYIINRYSKAVIIETYVNGKSWYRVYSDGWCEQGGYAGSGISSVSFLKVFANTDYTLTCALNQNVNSAPYWSDFGYNRTTTGFRLRGLCSWQASGYIN